MSPTNQRKRKNPRVEIHPMTIKALKSGHPWIIKDSFTNKFPKNDRFLIGKNSKNEDVALFINDPAHPKIKARLWSLTPPFQFEPGYFTKILKQRLTDALDKRLSSGVNKHRDHFYWAFGEVDQLPGLHVMQLGGSLIIQSKCHFWAKYQQDIKVFLTDLWKIHGGRRLDGLWWQERFHSQNERRWIYLKKGPRSFEVKEGEWRAKVRIEDKSDIGIYTDMAAVRKNVCKDIKEGSKVLNLFSYTGAYTLEALAKQASEVCSVDLSTTNMKWLEENLEINEHLDESKHTSMTMSVDSALKSLIKNDKKFDLIICDPPSSFSDGKKSHSAIKSIEKWVQQFEKLLSPSGKVCMFLNTHTYPRKKFKQQMKRILEERKNSFIQLQEISMHTDCPIKKQFPEGDYLKGVVWQRVDKAEI